MNTSPLYSKFPDGSAAREYDIFELMPDGSPIWRASAFGMESTERKLLELSRETANRVFAVNLADPTKNINYTVESRERAN
jgi:hypothetical protein